MSDHIRIMDQRASDRDYLHKDFHGALADAVRYLDETYGYEATAEYLTQVGRTCYAPLIDKLKQEGLPALEKHLLSVFTREDGRFSIRWENGDLVLEVYQCPAISHLVRTGRPFTPRFCQSTVHVNEAICRAAGYHAVCDYEPGKGRCVQRFCPEEKS
ncbi:hypothetical protein GX408_06050 [bacterium]|nr:hypothetical protein [bacterium]